MGITRKIKEKTLSATILVMLLFVMSSLAATVNATPTASLSPTSLTFRSQAVGTSSAAQFITLTNSGNTTLATTSSDNGAQFTAVVSNSAGSVTSNTATLTVNSAAGLSLSPTSLTFGSLAVGTSSAAQFVTVTNNSSTNVTFSASFGGDFGFAGTGTCGSTVAVGASCTISVKFTPTATGTRTGTLTLTDNAPNSPQTVSLTGTGGTASSAPTVTTQPANQTVTAGESATFTVVAAGTAPLAYQRQRNGAKSAR